MRFTMKIKYSLIIPVYNKETTLLRLFSQLNKIKRNDVEIIFVDDGSQDSSKKMLKQFASTTKNIFVLSQKNAGPGAARNTGLNKALGDYIWFIDSDDVFNINSFDLFDSLIKTAYSPDIIFFEYSIKSEFDLIFNDKLNSGFTEISNKHALLFEPVNPWSKIFKRTTLIQNNITFPKYYFAEDLCFTREAFCSAKKLIHTRNILYNYIDNANSITKTHFVKHGKDFNGICNYILKLTKKYPQYEEELKYNICDHTENYIENIQNPSLYPDLIDKLKCFITDNEINTNTYTILKTKVTNRITSSFRWKITEPLVKFKKLLKNK